MLKKEIKGYEQKIMDRPRKMSWTFVGSRQGNKWILRSGH